MELLAADNIFSEALQLATEQERRDYLDRVCSGDAALRRKVERLLDAFAAADEFLESPPPGLGTLAAECTAEPLGTQIGPYKLREILGEGGMGVVYVAEQEQPIRRKVALKIIKPGMDSRQVLARFDAERQALSVMDHPNIAKVLDAGVTESGRPYFVMELVRGVPITEFCDERRLDTRQRLEIFIQVCRAIQHAHQKGIIHRDIKPSNILVTLHDEIPVPKVIDFGIAKATGQRLTEQSVYTAFAQMVGTPLYISPEQAEMNAFDVDTRSDVYSLGVLLYELLTGTTPFDSEALRRAGFDEMRRMIREVEPPIPSQRFSTLDAKAASTVSQRRGADERRLGRELRGELDWIDMKALEKDRTRRYESASDLAADVQRFLDDQPVHACQPSAVYRLRKLVRRRKAAVLSGAALAAALLVGVIAVSGSVGFVVRDRSLRETETARAARLVLREADSLEQRARWPEALAATERAKAVVDNHEGNAELRALVRKRRDDLSMALRLEEIRSGAIPDSPSYLYDEAFRRYGINAEVREPEEIARQLPEGAVRDEFVGALDDWALLRRNIEMAEGLGWKRLLATAAAADPDPWRNRLREALRGRDFKALKELQGSVPLDERPHPSNVILIRHLILDRNVWAVLLEAQRRQPGDFWLNLSLAEHFEKSQPPQLQEALSFYRAAMAARPENARVLKGLGDVLEKLDRWDDAIATREHAVRVMPDSAWAHNNLGKTLAAKGAVDDAIPAFEKAISLYPDYAEAHCNLGHALRDNGQIAEALKKLRLGHEVGSKNPNWRFPSARWVQECEQLIDVAESGAAKPTAVTEGNAASVTRPDISNPTTQAVPAATAKK